MMGRELFLIEMRGMDETAAFAMGSVILEYILWLADYSGQLAHALKRVQRMGSAV